MTLLDIIWRRVPIRIFSLFKFNFSVLAILIFSKNWELLFEIWLNLVKRLAQNVYVLN